MKRKGLLARLDMILRPLIVYSEHILVTSTKSISLDFDDVTAKVLFKNT